MSQSDPDSMAYIPATKRLHAQRTGRITEAALDSERGGLTSREVNAGRWYDGE